MPIFLLYDMFVLSPSEMTPHYSDQTLHVHQCSYKTLESSHYMISQILVASWQQIGIDICSLKATTDGFRYIVVVVDYFNKRKWVEAKALSR